MTDFYVLRASIPRIQRCEYCLEELLIYLTEKQHLGSVGGGVFVKGKIELVFFLYMYITNTLNENLACQHLNLAYAKSGGLLPVQALASDARRISRSNILVTHATIRGTYPHTTGSIVCCSFVRYLDYNENVCISLFQGESTPCLFLTVLVRIEA